MNYQKVLIWGGIVGAATKLVAPYIAKLPQVNVTLATTAYDINVRNQYGALASGGSGVSNYLLGLFGQTALGQGDVGAWIATIVGVAILMFAGVYIAEMAGWTKNLMQRTVIPAVLAVILGTVVIVGTGAGWDKVVSADTLLLAIAATIAVAIPTYVYSLINDPFGIVP